LLLSTGNRNFKITDPYLNLNLYLKFNTYSIKISKFSLWHMLCYKINENTGKMG
jgi:hypothetical protein